MYEWTASQPNAIAFVMVNASSVEVAGLGSGFTLQVCKAGGAFGASAGVKAEIGSGWYSYVATAGEADTIGPVAIKVTGAGCVQQNLEYVVMQRTPNAIAFTYTVTDSATLLPLEGVTIQFYTDVGMMNLVWTGETDVFGVARDVNGQLPFLDLGTYYIRRTKLDFTGVNPDVEIVS